MKFKLDENLPLALSEFLNAVNHDSCTVAGQRLKGSSDDTLARICADEERALITFDTDFLDIRHFPPTEYHGIIVLRLNSQAPPTFSTYFDG